MIELNENNNPDVYYDFETGVEYLKTIENKELNHPVDFHAFWIGPFGRKPSLPIKSFFATQNTKFAKFNLWSREDLSNNEYLEPFKDKIIFRKWDPIEEAKGTILENLPELNVSDSRCWVDGDLFRLLVLHKYGGVYIDMDVVLLRDFAPILEHEFMYKWGTEKNMINGAIMHLKKESLLSQQLLIELKKRKPIPNSTCWGNDVYTSVRSYNKDWKVFPAVFFDTEWQMNVSCFEKYGLIGGRLEPFKKCKQSDFLFLDAFSWHWHGRWNDNIEDGSKWQKLEERTEQLLKKRFHI